MKKKTKNTTIWTKNKVAVISLTLVVLFVISTVLGIFKLRYYDETVEQVSTAQTRDFILLAARGLKKDAPVEPRTGDIYFPESKLYLPNPGIALPLTYLDDKGDVTNSQAQLSVSTYPVRSTEALYAARNAKELFDAVPKFQSCARGIKIVRQQFPASDKLNQLKQTVRLNNGQTVYVYVEKTCPELQGMTEMFKNLRAY
jgi:hypothetical protein